MGFAKQRNSPDGFANSKLALFYISLWLNVISASDERLDHMVYMTTAPSTSATRTGANIKLVYCKV